MKKIDIMDLGTVSARVALYQLIRVGCSDSMQHLNDRLSNKIKCVNGSKSVAVDWSLKMYPK